MKVSSLRLHCSLKPGNGFLRMPLKMPASRNCSIQRRETDESLVLCFLLSLNIYSFFIGMTKKVMLIPISASRLPFGIGTEWR
jgi:hypothetical protein